jgi:putative tricarboxylic transport membrane protein
MFENALRQSLILFDGSFLGFFTRLISAGLIIASGLLLLSAAVPWIKKRKHLLAAED